MGFWQRRFAQRTAWMKASDIREAFKLAEQGDIISFAGGFPSPETFPCDEVADVASEIASSMGATSLQYGPTEGFSELRALIAEKARRRGIPAEPEQVLITNGSQQALDLIAKVLIDPGDPVIVEKPAYIGALSAIGHYQASFHAVALDDEGMRVEDLEEMLCRGNCRPKLVYVVPNFHNPAGVTMSAARRAHLMELARRYDFVVIEDDPYGALRYEGEPQASLKTWDSDERVMVLGSFSKEFIPGLRLGYVIAARELVQKLIIAKQGADLCSNSFGQRLMIECERRGIIDQHLKRLVPFYRQKRDVMLAALQTHFPGEVHYTRPEGGFFVWVTLPEKLDAKALLPKAVNEYKVAYVSGGAFFVDGTGANTIRLAFSQASDEQIAEGIKRLGSLLSDALGRGPSFVTHAS